MSRNETPTERADRNWNELLQELRVSQTGIQLLTAFLLSLPFQPRFDHLDTPERVTYLTALLAAVASTAFLISPVAIHRAVFRRHVKPSLVQAGHLLAIVGLGLLCVAVCSVVALVFSVVVARWAGIVAAGGTLTLIAGLWTVLPAVVRARGAGDALAADAAPSPGGTRAQPVTSSESS